MTRQNQGPQLVQNAVIATSVVGHCFSMHCQQFYQHEELQSVCKLHIVRVLVLCAVHAVPVCLVRSCVCIRV